MVPQTWTTSTRLKTVSINIGFSRSVHAVLERSKAAASFLKQVGLCAPDLQSLQIRGRMSVALNESVVALASLRSLTIQSNCFLAPSTLVNIATFPSLRVLEVHASHIQADEFEELLAPEATCFPALQELTIRTEGPLLSAILHRIPVGTLTKLHVDLEKCLRGPAYMKPILELLAQKASTSLRDLTIEDRTELDELEGYLLAHDNPQWYTLDVLGPLARMNQLQRFVLRDPDATDANLEQMAKWWPQLKHLDLGTLDAEHSAPKWKAQISSAAYDTVAKSFTRLESLALPAIPPISVGPEWTQLKGLRLLTVGDVPSASADGPAIVDALLTMFPDLDTLHCPCTVISERFETVVGTARLF